MSNTEGSPGLLRASTFRGHYPHGASGRYVFAGSFESRFQQVIRKQSSPSSRGKGAEKAGKVQPLLQRLYVIGRSGHEP